MIRQGYKKGTSQRGTSFVRSWKGSCLDAMKRRVRRAVFLDRDGVINKKAPEGDYIKNWDEFEFLPGVEKAIRTFNENGFLVIIVSNQRGIARGLMTEEDLKEIHSKMREELAKDGAVIDGIYYCPHDLDDHCGCRKPAPGLLLEAAKEHNVDLSQSWMIGDQESDIEAGRRAGCKTILISNAISRFEKNEPELMAETLLEAAYKLLSRTSKRNGLKAPERTIT